MKKNNIIRDTYLTKDKIFRVHIADFIIRHRKIRKAKKGRWKEKENKILGKYISVDINKNHPLIPSTSSSNILQFFCFFIELNIYI